VGASITRTTFVNLIQPANESMTGCFFINAIWRNTMTTKTETPAANKAPSETKTDAKAAPEKTATTSTAPSTQTAESASPSTAPTDAGTHSHPNALSPEIIELLTELRDTVKGLNPRKHTAKTLRRALANVSDILADIDKLYQQD
jgi:cytoskeletal protein RodZ